MHATPLHSSSVTLSCSSGYPKLHHAAVRYTALHCTALLSILFILLPLLFFSCKVPYFGTMSTFESNTVSEPFDSVEAERDAAGSLLHAVHESRSFSLLAMIPSLSGVFFSLVRLTRRTN